MSGIACDMIRVATLDLADRPRGWMARPDVTTHLRECEDCREWLQAFGAGEQAWTAEPGDTFTDSVLARTSGVASLIAELPSLAELDPGPGFTERVLLATSGKPAPETWRARLALSWRAMVRRPRFAWEAAYVATVCWVLVFGNPVGALERSASSLQTAARVHLGGPAKTLHADFESWRARWAPDSPTVPGVASSQAGAEPTIVRVWRAGTSQVRWVTSYVLDVLARAWTWVGDWASWLVNELWPPPAEPDARPVRSAQ